ncbi:MAG TPA: PP2C family protein-serine/threonine phosphatase [Patescibacteria group bacterium]|nr:PP2C family protein-serine/threonine phosphatase [Patescibacteria group bacterium]
MSNNLLPNLPPIPAQPGDHARAINSVQVSTHQGLRAYQEDRYLVAAGLAIPDARSFLQEAFAEAATETNRYRSGATGTGLVIDNNKVTTAFLGDSPVVIFTRDPLTGDVAARKLTRDHHAARNDEKELVEDAGGWVHANGRVSGTLMLSRAFGDAGIRGVLREPEYATYDLQKDLAAGKEVFVLLSSDGLYDGARHRDYIAPLKEAMAAGQESRLAEIFTAFAYQKGSADNITALVHKIDPQQSGALFLALADGHGGHAAADKVIGVSSAKAKAHAP